MAKIIYLQSNRWPAMTARIPIQSIHCRFRRDLQSNQSTVGTAERRPLRQWPHHSGKQCQCKLCRWISQLNAKCKLNSSHPILVAAQVRPQILINRVGSDQLNPDPTRIKYYRVWEQVLFRFTPITNNVRWVRQPLWPPPPTKNSSNSRIFCWVLYGDGERWEGHKGCQITSHCY